MRRQQSLLPPLRIPLFVLLAFLPLSAFASGSHDSAINLLWIAVLLLLAQLSSLVEKIGQPAVLGELVIGVLVGNLTLVGIHVFDPVKTNPIIAFLAELGVIILLFQIGLESNVNAMRKVGARALMVALIGVVVPFVFGTMLIGPMLFPHLSLYAHLFFGATLTATSVGITARVFKDMGTLQMRESQIVLGAAVIDDVIGLIILAVVSAVVMTGEVSLGSISWIMAKALLFLVGALVLGQLTAPIISRWFAKINTGVGMKFTLAIFFCFTLAYLAQMIGLAPIVGAFAAGLILDEVTFKDYDQDEIITDVKRALTNAPPEYRKKVNQAMRQHAEHQLQSLTTPVGYLFVPVFFVYTGMQVDISSLFDPRALMIALVVTLLAIIGKLVSGLAAGPVNKWIVGWGMVPRGEVGLIFAVVGKQLGVVDDQAFSVVVIMIMLTTMLTPLVLTKLLRRQRAQSA